MRKEVLRIGISISIEIGFDDRNKMKHLICRVRELQWELEAKIGENVL